jgi:hypothetical protein
MNNELETTATLNNGRTMDIVVAYEADGYKPLVYGIFDADERDLTNEVSDIEYDRIYGLCSQHLLDSMTEAAEACCEGER